MVRQFHDEKDKNESEAYIVHLLDRRELYCIGG